MRNLKISVGLAALFVAAGVGASPAVAQTADAATAGVRITAHPAAQDGRVAAACNGVPVEVYGYRGCAKSGSRAMRCSSGEWFVIAPSRTIWHAWPGSGGWKEMPHHGRADDTWNCFYNSKNLKQVEVRVGDKIYYSVRDSHGSWSRWSVRP